MRGNAFHHPNDDNLNSYRQSVSFLSSQLIRNSFSGDASILPSYRQSLGLQNKARNSMNFDMGEHLRKSIEIQKKEKQKMCFSNLKSTLGQLEKKINKAKKQLNTYKNIITEEESDEQTQNKYDIFEKKPQQFSLQSTAVGSTGKIPFVKSIPDFSSYPKIKTYYLSHLSQAFEGKNNRAMEHLLMSLKVLRNYYKIESTSFSDLEEKRVNLIKNKIDINKKTLILDIDQTIIHCEEDETKPHDLVLPIKIQSGETVSAFITIRPYAISFLKRMSKHFQIIAFTASHQSYADVVLDEIDPDREYIKHRLYRKNCIQIHKNIYAKDLRIINRDLSNMVLVDNAPYSYIFQLQNGIPILPYYNGEDNQLVHLQKYLEGIAKCQDVRQYNKKIFKLHKYCNFSELEHLVRDLYFHQI